jgi:hypothetical protein
MTKVRLTKAQVVDDALRVALTLQGPLTRDYLREKSEFTDKQRSKFFSKHDDILSAITDKLTPTQRKAGIGKPLAGGQLKSREERAALPNTKGIKRYILTSAQNNTHVHEAFWANVQAFAKHYDATIMVGTFSYNQNKFGKLAVKRGTKKDYEYTLWFDEKIEPFIKDRTVLLAPDLLWCGEMNILPTEANPLSGLESHKGGSSVIFPHTKIEMRSVAMPPTQPVKMLYTTGAVTQLNYVQKKAGQKAEHHHRYAFLIVEVDGKGNWWVRQVAARKNGRVIQDLNVLVENGVVTSTTAPVAAIVWGDIHATKADPKVTAAAMDMLDTLKPKHQALHDLFEGAGFNPHNRKYKDNHDAFATWLRGLHRVSEEFARTKAIIEQYLRPGCKTIVPDANHDRKWLKRWLSEFDYRVDPANAELFLRLQEFMYSEIRKGKLPKDVNLVERAMVNEAGLAKDAVLFLTPDKPYFVGEVALDMHGHLGANGSNGSPLGLSKLGVKMTTAHTHTAGIYHGLYVAGTSTALTPEWGYTTGPSAWSHSHVLQYDNGQRAIVTQRGERWRA